MVVFQQEDMGLYIDDGDARSLEGGFIADNSGSPPPTPERKNLDVEIELSDRSRRWKCAVVQQHIKAPTPGMPILTLLYTQLFLPLPVVPASH
jgi:hypothetical protein